MRNLCLRSLCWLLCAWLLAWGAGPLRADAGVRPKLTLTTFPSHGMGKLFSRILTEAYGRIGYDIEVLHVAPAQGLVMSNSGEVDGEAARVPVIESHHRNLVRVPTPLYTNRIVIYAREGRVLPAAGWDGLMRLRIGIVKGYKFIEAQTSLMNRVFFADYQQLFSMLAKGQVDAVMVEQLDSLSAYSSMKPEGVELISPPLAYNPMYHYLNRKHEELVPIVDAALKGMVEDGTMKSLFKQYTRELQQ